MSEITSTAEIAETEWNGHGEPSEVRTDMVATHDPEGKGIEFHVSMRDYTMNDMEALIVEAAARSILGRFNQATIAKAIEDKCVELISAKATAALQQVTDEIIDQPITPSFGDRKPVTMREFIGLTGREYLTAPCDWQGRSKGDHHFDGTRTTRIQWLVDRTMDRHFKNEIEKATTAAIISVQAEIKKHHNAFIEQEKARIREALATSVKPAK